jgi:hypothetical protein
MELNYTRLLYLVLVIVGFTVVIWYKKRRENKDK